MIEYVHRHITSELDQNTKTDTIFILAAIILNFITLAINSSIAGKNDPNASDATVMFVFALLTVVVNIVAILGLLKGRQTRAKLTNGLLKMYKDQNVEGYYDPSLLSNHSTRYTLFILVVVFTGIISIVVPYIIK